MAADRVTSLLNAVQHSIGWTDPCRGSGCWLSRCSLLLPYLQHSRTNLHLQSALWHLVVYQLGADGMIVTDSVVVVLILRDRL